MEPTYVLAAQRGTLTEAREHVLRVEIDDPLLVSLAGVDVNDAHTAIKQLSHYGDVSGRISTDRPLLYDLVNGNLRFGPLLYLFRI